MFVDSHFYTDILPKLAGTDVAWKYQGYVVGIYQLQGNCSVNPVKLSVYDL